MPKVEKPPIHKASYRRVLHRMNSYIMEIEPHLAAVKRQGAYHMDPSRFTQRLDNHFERLKKVLIILRANFGCTETTRTILINSVIVMTMVSIAVWSLCYDMHIIFAYEAYKKKSFTTQMVLMIWSFQSIISTCFLVYWQRNGDLRQFLDLLFKAQNAAGVSIRQAYSHLYCITVQFYIAMAVQVLIMVVMCTLPFMEIEHRIVDEKFNGVFYFPQLRIIRNFVFFYLVMCWNIALFIYRMFISGAYWEIYRFNDQLEKIPETEENLLCEQLLGFIKVHSRLTCSIRSLDKTFQVYAFIMVATNIPTTIFTLLMVMSEHKSWVDVVVDIPSVIFCLYGFVGITAAPATLHNALYASKSILCMNNNVWFPYRENVYRMASSFVMHLEQTDLGISIWGFAVVSKPLILTTFSVMMTCLALMMEFQSKSDCGDALGRSGV